MHAPPSPSSERAALAGSPISQKSLPCNADTTETIREFQAALSVVYSLSLIILPPRLPSSPSRCRDEPAHKTAGNNRAPSKDYTLALIRVVSRRLKHIDEEVVSIGVALSNGLVTAAKARELVDEIAPGCIDAVALSILEGAVE